MTDPAPTKTFPNIQGRCPACRGDSLFIGTGGWVTCSRLDCPNPSAADQLLHGEAATDPELRQRLDDAEKVIAHLEDGEKLRLRAETELAALRAVARGYCPACGRGDAAPTVADWEEQKQRADRAEAERDTLRRMLDPDDLRLVDEMVTAVEQHMARADRAEAEIAACRKQQWPKQLAAAEDTIERVRNLHAPHGSPRQTCWECSDSDNPVPWPCPTVAALDEPAPADTQTTDDQEQPGA